MFRLVLRFGPMMEFQDKEEIDQFLKGFALGKTYDVAFVQDDAAGIVYIDGAAMGTVVRDLDLSDINLKSIALR